jgi:hypothetical protein
MFIFKIEMDINLALYVSSTLILSGGLNVMTSVYFAWWGCYRVLPSFHIQILQYFSQSCIIIQYFNLTKKQMELFTAEFKCSQFTHLQMIKTLQQIIFQNGDHLQLFMNLDLVNKHQALKCIHLIFFYFCC